MKRLWLCLGIVLTSLQLMAQGEGIRFALMEVTGEEIPADAVKAFDAKLRQAFNRTQALTEDEYALFAIRPTLTVEEAAATEGLVRDINKLSGSLNLELINTLDGTVLYGSPISVSATVTGSKNEAFKKMATNIKSTDPVFVRYVRNARKRIAQHYDENCSSIIKRAETLAATGRTDEAVKILFAIPPEVDCYDTARLLLVEIDGEPAEVPETPTEEEPVSEEPVPQETPEPEAEPAPAPQIIKPELPREEPQQPEPAESDFYIKMSHPDRYSFKVLSCIGNRMGDQVTILGEFINQNCSKDAMVFRLAKAFDENSDESKSDDLKVRDKTWTTINTPKSIPVKIEMKVRNVDPKIKKFLYLYLDIDGMNVEMYNLPINWR